MRKLIKWAAISMGSMIFLAGIALLIVSARTPLDLEDFQWPENTRLLDRHGRELYFIPDSSGVRHVWVSENLVPAVVKHAFLAAEDERFYKHSGFDSLAIVRAIKDNIGNGRIVSGASTITQQLVKQVYPRKRTYSSKLLEVIRSCKLERKLTKDQIFEQYLNRIYMGNNVAGIGLAARIYFNKKIELVTPAEAALLASLPKAPGYFNPYGPNRDALIARKNWVLTRMLELKFLTDDEYQQSLEVKLHFEKRLFCMEAPHLINHILQEYPRISGKIKTTLDKSLQRKVEKILLSHRDRLQARGARQASCIIVHNPTSEVLAVVGSFQYGSRDLGFNDGAHALRSPGSTLKPFMYALALEQGFTAASILEDTDQRFAAPQGEYIPANFDRSKYGPVTLRTALGNSLNLSAVRLLNKLGYDHLYDRLMQSGLINFPEYGPDYYGLGMVVGNPEVTLAQLVQAYSMLANGGIFKEIRYFSDPVIQDAEPQRIFSRDVSSVVTDILSDPGARSITFSNSSFSKLPFKVALKTGTSTHYRDCWTIGYTPEYTIGIWVGNFDGGPTWTLSGASAAGPLFTDIVMFLYRYGSPGTFVIPETVVTKSVCSFSGMKPGRFCQHTRRELFVSGTEKQLKTCSYHSSGHDEHRVPYTYARWLYERNQNGTEGKYRLDSTVPGKRVEFDDPWKKLVEYPGRDMISVKSQPTAKHPDKSESSLLAHSRKNKNRISIGADWSSFSRSASPLSPLRVTYPLEGDRYILDRRLPEQNILFQADSPVELKTVTWFVNGVEYARSGPPFQIYWKMKRGNYEVLALTQSGYGDSVSFTVE